ncbi:hypothetical protein I7X12_20335 [Halosimplex litoreum]|uniref:Uncharacterized protein n=1 Tax=Halosimplex litoreum TaxID=1198301 RepID=A0A7T3KV72_9EURY|nr:hypothetical protein [Halosimplex litoreum]QPV63029.1 hypothetical protein I7X12_20335 [Halosimplex litoreum]
MTASEYADDGAAGDGAAGDRRRMPAPGSDEKDAPWHRRRWTTIVLEEYGGGWRATQTGVAAEGHGETAADAAAAYCRRIAQTGDRRSGGGDDGSEGHDTAGAGAPASNARGGRDG